MEIPEGRARPMSSDAVSTIRADGPEVGTYDLVRVELEK